VVSRVEAATTPRRVAETVATFVPSPAGRALPIPISGSDQWPTLYLPGRITEDDWNQMILVLQAMKPGIVAREAAAETAHGTGQAHDATVQITRGEENDDPD
jgi:hypothetical protein